MRRKRCHKMGQENSQPLRCNPTNDNYRTSSLSTKSNTSVKSATSTTSLSSTTTTQSILSTKRPPSTTSSSSRTSYKSLDRQSKYLSEHLYIKSYLDLEEEDRNAKRNFRPAPPGGIRNYKPKILTEKQKQTTKKEVDVWI